MLPPMELVDALEALVMALQSVWKKLKEVDKPLIVYPWCNKESKNLSALTKLEDIPERVPAIQEYFNRAFPRNRSFKEMHSEDDWWLVQEVFRWYKKALQCESRWL